MIEMETEVKVILQVMVDIIPMDPVYAVVPRAPQIVVMGLHDDPYAGCSDRSSSLEFGRWHRHVQHSQQHDQFEQSMITMNNSLNDLLQCQQECKMILLMHYKLYINLRETI